MALPTGTGTAIITPFGADGAVDHAALAALARWQVDQGIDFIVSCGSTGEAQTLTAPERLEVTTTLVEAVGDKAAVLAGATDNATDRAVAEAKSMAALGVVGIMSASPYYNKPTQAGLAAHFRAIADAIPVPLLLYNVPGRTAIDLKPETVAELALYGNIGGIKEASASARRILDLVRSTPADFKVFSGDDDMAVPAIASGACGLISVAGNALPGLISAMVTAALQGRTTEAAASLRRLLPLIDALFAESNPIPVKALLQAMGRSSDQVRLPLLPATPQLRARLDSLIKDLEVLHV